MCWHGTNRTNINLSLVNLAFVPNKPHVHSNKLFFFFKLNSLSCFEAKKLEPYRDATVVWQGNWLPRIPLSSSSPSKEDAKWKQKSPNEAWMIKEARGEHLSNCRHYTFFLLFVSSSVHFQLRAADGVKGREVLHHRGIINMKETRQIKKKN